MFRSHSDINERLPRFREALKSIGDTVRKGGYEGVDSAILEYLGGMEPVGLDEFGVVVLPSFYRPENGPPVLMLRPHETDSTIVLPGTYAEAATATRIAKQSGRHTAYVSRGHTRGTVSVSHPNEAYVSHAAFSFGPTLEDSYDVLVPQLMVVSFAARNESFDSTFAHEGHHWDFGLNHNGPLQSNPQKRYTKTELFAITEKRAYGTTHVVDQNMGRCATLASLDEIIEEYAHLAPAEMGDRLREHIYGERGNLSHSLAVAAITNILGNADTLVTPEEVIAMQHLQVI